MIINRCNLAFLIPLFLPSSSPPIEIGLPPSAPSSDYSDTVSTIFNTARVSEQVIHLNFVSRVISGINGRIKVDDNTRPLWW
ncbi:hypothetical protein Lser_V15G21324 [Lactuca serriola]